MPAWQRLKRALQAHSIRRLHSTAVQLLQNITQELRFEIKARRAQNDTAQDVCGYHVTTVSE